MVITGKQLSCRNLRDIASHLLVTVTGFSYCIFQHGRVSENYFAATKHWRFWFEDWFHWSWPNGACFKSWFYAVRCVLVEHYFVCLLMFNRNFFTSCLCCANMNSFHSLHYLFSRLVLFFVVSTKNCYLNYWWRDVINNIASYYFNCLVHLLPKGFDLVSFSYN